MISYHPGSADAPVGTTFTAGFLAADVDDPNRIAKCVVKFAWSPSVFKDGYRNQKNFLSANWLGLDFDSPEITLAEIANSICDMTHVLGTTRNHQRPKDGVTCDRFRLLLRAERRMSAPEVVATLRRLAEKWPVDKSCLESARHFFPCREIISIGVDGYLQEVINPPAEQQPGRHDARALMTKMRFQRNGALPQWLEAFLKSGQQCRRMGRNNTIYAATIALRDLGFSAEEVTAMISAAPINRHDLSESSILATINSGLRRAK